MALENEVKAKMATAIDHLKQDLNGIRTGRANPAMLDSVVVEVYGSQMRIRDLAQVSTPEPRQLLITSFDPQNVAFISKAIEQANLGFMPNVDGHLIRINIPQMDANIRNKMVKMVHEMREKAKVVIRNIRRDFNELVRKQKSTGDIGEDLLKRHEKEIQELTDKFCKEADELSAKKEKEVMTV